MSDEVIFRIIRVIEELIVIKRTSKKKNRIWVKKWILRRRSLGASNCLLRELSTEDTKSYHNFLRMDEEMFNFLLNKVYYDYVNITTYYWATSIFYIGKRHPKMLVLLL